MNSEFYRDLEKRMYSIALFGQLFALLKSRGTTLNRFGFERLDQQILLFFMVLRYIMEKTLASEPCFLEDIAQTVRQVTRDVFGNDLDEARCLDLAELCVSSILCNRGEPFFFDPVEGDERWKVRINYLNSEVVYQNGTPKASYRMSDDGFHLMLSTLEMEENMQLQFRDLVFELQLKAGNYPRALDEIREIFQLLKIQEMEIQNRCEQVRSNAAVFNGAAYEELNEQTYNLMNESRDKFSEYRKTVGFLLEELHSSVQSGQFSEKDEKNLQALIQIQDYLGRSLLAQSSILEALNRFSALYNDQLEHQLRQSLVDRKPFREAVWNAVMDRPDRLENLDALLHTLFRKPLPKQFALERAFQYRRLRKNPEDDSWQAVDESFDEEEYERRKREKLERVEKLNTMVQEIVVRLLYAPGHAASLSELLDSDFFENLDQARVILSDLSSVVSLNLQDLYGQREEIILEEQSTFSFPLALLQAMENEPTLQYFAFLQIRKAAGKASFVVRENQMDMQVQVDDLDLRLERRQL